MFRYAIKTESELVSLKDELEHSENYLKIQKIRYGEKLVYSYEVEDGLKEEKVLKLILQPIIENTFHHAFEDKEGLWTLQIKVWMLNQTITLEVQDNGMGIAPERLDELQKLLNQPLQITDLGKRTRQSIGLKNIHSRIGLYYGRDYGLNIENTSIEGTKIIIRVPRLN
jgi:two-component system sensor histidine kinase YesM